MAHDLLIGVYRLMPNEVLQWQLAGGLIQNVVRRLLIRSGRRHLQLDLQVARNGCRFSMTQAGDLYPADVSFQLFSLEGRENDLESMHHELGFTLTLT